MNVDTGPITGWEAAVSGAYEGSIKVFIYYLRKGISST